MTLQQLFHHWSTWTRGARARDMNGNHCDGRSSHAVAFCLLGALDQCYPDYYDWQAALSKIQDVLEPSCMNIVEWNDHPNRTFEEVCELIKKAGV